ncbi:MAG: trypsin-like peptidase domain-containing protein [Planctomycetota bacterium]|nr:trypsin-like peptidase domain-containing protein [Planctomycetota bacterium]
MKANENPFRLLEDITNITAEKKIYSAAGVAVAEGGVIATNAHVVSDFKDFYVTTYDGRTYAGKPIRVLHALDIAFVRIEEDLPPVPLCQYDKVSRGRTVFSVGTPFRLPFSVSTGVISATHRGRVGFSDIEDYIQTDAAINPGSSGGPLCDLDGNLVGLNSSIYSLDSRGSNGIGFAVPSYLIEAVLDNSLEGRPVGDATLGVRPSVLDFDDMIRTGYDSTRGALIEGVLDGSPAQASGIRPDDVIFAVDGMTTSTPFVLRALIFVRDPGETVRLGVFRDGAKLEIPVVLGRIDPTDPPRMYILELEASVEKPDAATIARYNLGNLPCAAQVDYFQYKGLAHQVGLDSRDVIIAVNDKEFSTLTELRELVSTAISRGYIKIRFIDSDSGTETEHGLKTKR